MPVSEIYDNGVLRALTPADLSGGASVPPIMAVIDSATPPKRWVMVTDYRSSPATVTFYEFGTTTVGTPTLPVSPDDDADSATAANQLIEIARLEDIRASLPAAPHQQALTDQQLRAAAVPVSGTVGLTSNNCTPGWQRVVAAGIVNSSVASGSYSVDFTAVSGNVTVAGVTLNAGETVSWQAPLGDKLGAIQYTVSAGELVISRVY